MRTCNSLLRMTGLKRHLWSTIRRLAAEASPLLLPTNAASRAMSQISPNRCDGPGTVTLTVTNASSHESSRCCGNSEDHRSASDRRVLVVDRSERQQRSARSTFRKPARLLWVAEIKQGEDLMWHGDGAADRGAAPSAVRTERHDWQDAGGRNRCRSWTYGRVTRNVMVLDSQVGSVYAMQSGKWQPTNSWMVRITPSQGICEILAPGTGSADASVSSRNGV